jgi:(heptosyl)LPS beta-1,4-glucosyltransferase
MESPSIKRISAVIITKNEERTLGACLESLQGIIDEIIIIDSFSSDNTKSIATSLGATFIQKEWKGYAQTKNIGNSLAKYDWILSIDADEVLSPELKKSILDWKVSNNAPYCEVTRLTNYCGKWIKHGGWYPEVKLRLFNRTHTNWEGDFVHEQLVTSYENQPNTLRLTGDLWHYSFPTIESHLFKINHFSTLAAKERAKKGKGTSISKIVLSPIWKFLSMYLIKKGFLDGLEGYVIASLSAYDKFIREVKIYYLMRK